ncbi:MAG: glycosyltransferase family 39 protein, partial [Planctomycetota bacterium]|nr:glycosyltransferase family 39 protein [Planctomycetota bacterium]
MSVSAENTEASVPPPFRRVWLWPALIAFASWLAVASSIDAVGNYPFLGEGPGLTTDEPLNVGAGHRLVEGTWGWIIGRYTLREVWDDEPTRGPQSGLGRYQPDYPPLGRLWLGAFERLTPTVLAPQTAERQTAPWITVCSRFASATAFALTVYLVGLAAGRWHGQTAGAAAAMSLVLMPRVFGHAHVASVESTMGLLYCWAVLNVARNWDPRSATRKTPFVAGLITGLALLTKIQAVFLGPVILLWCLFHGGRKSIGRIVIWGVTSLTILFVGWPWLWLDPVNHAVEYFAQTTERVQLYVWYFGEKIADRDVPWHYVPLMFVTTVPIGLQLFGVAGLWCAIRAGMTSAEQLILGSLMLPMIVLSLPGIAVYDGPRLFLVSFPLWAIFVGRGVSISIDFVACRLKRGIAIAGVWSIVAMQGFGLVHMRPCYLSYYNGLVGGVSGAE